MNNTIEKNIANALTNAINIIGFSPEKVAEELKHQHRALQEDFTRVCIEWLKTVASPDYSYDVRNELAHISAQELLHPKKWAVITIYSFDVDIAIKYFDTQDDASEYMREDFIRERDIAVHENGKNIINGTKVDSFAGFATLKTSSTIDEVDVMDWRIVEINI